LIVKRSLYIFLALHLLGLPRRPMLQHGVEYGETFMHTGRQGHFFDLPRGKKPLTNGFDPWVVARGHETAHVQHGTPMRAASPNGTPAPQGPTVTIAGRHTDQGRDPLPRRRPQLGEFQHQRPGTHGSHARGTLQEIVVFSPERTAPQHRLKVVVQYGQALVEPGHVGCNVRLEASARPLVVTGARRVRGSRGGNPSAGRRALQGRHATRSARR